MKKIKLILILLVLISSDNFFGQQIELHQAKLNINNSRRIPYNAVEISFTNRYPKNESAEIKVKSTPLNNSNKWSYSKIDTILFYFS